MGLQLTQGDQQLSSQGTTPLLKLTGKKMWRYSKCYRLCNLSLSGCISAEHSQFIAAVDVRSLAAFLCSADTTYRLFGAVTLGNLASKEHHQEIVGKVPWNRLSPFPIAPILRHKGALLMPM